MRVDSEMQPNVNLVVECERQFENPISGSFGAETLRETPKISGSQGQPQSGRETGSSLRAWNANRNLIPCRQDKPRSVVKVNVILLLAFTSFNYVIEDCTLQCTHAFSPVRISSLSGDFFFRVYLIVNRDPIQFRYGRAFFYFFFPFLPLHSPRKTHYAVTRVGIQS